MHVSWLLITPGFIACDIIDIVRLINRRKLNGTARARARAAFAFLTSLQKYSRGIDRARALLTLRRNAPSTQWPRVLRLSIGENNGRWPGDRVSVYFIMLYVLGSAGDKKVTNPSRQISDLRVDNARCVIAISWHSLSKLRESCSLVGQVAIKIFRIPLGFRDNAAR